MYIFDTHIHTTHTHLHTHPLPFYLTHTHTHFSTVYVCMRIYLRMYIHAGVHIHTHPRRYTLKIARYDLWHYLLDRLFCTVIHPGCRWTLSEPGPETSELNLKSRRRSSTSRFRTSVIKDGMRGLRVDNFRPNILIMIIIIAIIIVFSFRRVFSQSLT